MVKKELGKITHATFGFGGYQDAQIGLSLTFGGKGWGTGDFDGHWSTDCRDSCEWTDAGRLTSLGQTVMTLAGLLEKAKVKDVSDLVGIPVEVTFNDHKLSDWRILTEVL